MKRYPKRAVHDKATIHAILDEVSGPLFSERDSNMTTAFSEQSPAGSSHRPYAHHALFHAGVFTWL